jgi:hypothetical protein
MTTASAPGPRPPFWRRALREMSHDSPNNAPASRREIFTLSCLTLIGPLYPATFLLPAVQDADSVLLLRIFAPIVIVLSFVSGALLVRSYYHRVQYLASAKSLLRDLVGARDADASWAVSTGDMYTIDNLKTLVARARTARNALLLSSDSKLADQIWDSERSLVQNALSDDSPIRNELTAGSKSELTADPGNIE